ncbi:MAG: t-SNARE [Benniella sp.]|nr:MAG: t-SNARE [Benniella sp.]
MSFADLERGEGRRTTRAGSDNVYTDNNLSNQAGGSHVASRASAAAFSARVNKLSQQVFRISSNVASIQRLVDLLGTSKDTDDLRTELHDLTEQTRELVRETNQDIKALANLDNTHAKKLEYRKISKDFQMVLVDFQKVQRVSAERQREFVDRARLASSHNGSDDGRQGQYSGQLSQSDYQRRMQLMIIDNEVDFNESLIGQREEEIREIESGITELNEIFRDIGSMVYEQNSLLDSIENNVTPIRMRTQAASEELTTAARRQRKARRRSCCILIVVALVAAVVVFAILG